MELSPRLCLPKPTWANGVTKYSWADLLCKHALSATKRVIYIFNSKVNTVARSHGANYPPWLLFASTGTVPHAC